MIERIANIYVKWILNTYKVGSIGRVCFLSCLIGNMCSYSKELDYQYENTNGRLIETDESVRFYDKGDES